MSRWIAARHIHEMYSVTIAPVRRPGASPLPPHPRPVAARGGGGCARSARAHARTSRASCSHSRAAPPPSRRPPAPRSPTVACAAGGGARAGDTRPRRPPPAGPRRIRTLAGDLFSCPPHSPATTRLRLRASLLLATCVERCWHGVQCMSENTSPSTIG